MSTVEVGITWDMTFCQDVGVLGTYQTFKNHMESSCHVPPLDVDSVGAATAQALPMQWVPRQAQSPRCPGSREAESASDTFQDLK